MAFLVGKKVEVRARNVDELFYGATVTGFDEENNVYSVHYEDGTDDSGLKRESMIVPDSRTVVFEDDFLKVVDGHAVWMGKIRRTRMLAFQQSPELFQSAIMFSSEDSSLTLDYASLIFDVDQALACSYVLLMKEKQKQREPLKNQIQILVLGAGGGALPMFLYEKMEQQQQQQQQLDEGFQVDVVELSEQVVMAAHEYFHIPKLNDRLNMITMDGLDYVAQCGKSYDLIVLDVASCNGMENDDDDDDDDDEKDEMKLELPPGPFVEKEFLVDHLQQIQNGWIAMNVIAGRKRLETLITKVEAWFETVFVIACDPNYCFLMHKEKDLLAMPKKPGDIVEWASELNVDKDLHCVLQDIAETERNINRSTLLGFFTCSQFKELLLDPKVMV